MRVLTIGSKHVYSNGEILELFFALPLDAQQRIAILIVETVMAHNTDYSDEYFIRDVIENTIRFTVKIASYRFSDEPHFAIDISPKTSYGCPVKWVIKWIIEEHENHGR